MAGLTDKQSIEEAYLDTFIPGKAFEHCLITWTIDNFSFIPEEEDKCVTSPFFHLNTTSTIWSLRFFPHKKVGDSRCLKFCIDRYNTDDGSELVAVTYRFGMQGDAQNIWYNERSSVSFKRGTEDSISFPINTDDSNHFMNENTVTVLLEMYISSQQMKSIPVPKNDVELVDLMRLSFNTLQILKLSDLSDVKVFHKGGKYFCLHKCILSSRSPKFAQLVDDYFYVRVDEEDYSHIHVIIQYMYSANTNTILKNYALSIGLYECAKKYSVNGLTELLAPTKICLSSVIETEKFEFTWTVENFGESILTDECLMSPPFSNISPNSPIWYFEIYPKGLFSDSDWISILLRSSQTVDAVYINTAISMLNDKQEVVFKQQSVTPLISKSSFGFLEFIQSNMLSENYGNFFNGKITVKCNVLMYVFRHYYEGSSVVLEPKHEGFPCLYRLSSDLETLLYKRNIHSDITISTQFNQIYAHKCILSPILANIVKYFGNENNTEIKDVKKIFIPEVKYEELDEILFYVYTGRLRQISAQSCIKLYETASKFELTHLLKRCIRILLNNLNVENVCEIIKFSYKFKIRKVAEECVAYIPKHREEVLSSEGWVQLMQEQTELIPALRKWVENNFKDDI